MTLEIVKTCKKHGPLTADMVRPEKRLDRTSNYVRCRACLQEISRRYGEKMKAKRRRINTALADI